jgi:1,4-alpha-glucan branching enzyme
MVRLYDREFMSKPEIVKNDPWLEPYCSSIETRINRFKNEKRRIEQTVGACCAHEYYGEHSADGKTIIREWAPNASQIFLLCEAGSWMPTAEYEFTRLNDYGDWEIALDKDLFGHKSLYRMLVRWNSGEGERIPAYTRRVVQDPETHIFSAQIWFPDQRYQWKHYLPEAKGDAQAPPVIYEAHIGMALEAERIGSYNEFRLNLVPRIEAAGFNTIQFMALMEHPYYASFGYQVSSFFAVSSRYGTPEEFKALVDECHGRGMKVIMDLVHSHAVKNEVEGIGLQDGTDYLYFHSRDRGRHPAWDSRCFNYGKHETINFLLSNCRFWMEEYRLDGFRFDGITSMLYLDHGLGASFDHYDKYYGPNVDEEAVLYLSLANDLIHRMNPAAITVAEDMSGMPGTGAPVEDGGLGFDFRLTMGLPDYWIKTIKEVVDEEWQVSKIWAVLNNRRYGDKHISYSESHDQALVGDMTIIFRLMDAAMYSDMKIDTQSLAADRGTAYYRLINLLTFSVGGDGFLCFMGNEFGHPEWIDFPREGNHWSYHYARRQWSLADNPKLRYSRLQKFTCDMIKNCTKALSGGYANLVHCHDSDNVIAYTRGGLLFAVNINPTKSYTSYGLPAKEGLWVMIFNTDSVDYDGHNRLVQQQVLETETGIDGISRLSLYLPSKSALVLKPEDKMTEWLETNGAGGFCASTAIERNDRKYHGLLICPTTKHEGRYHFLSAVDARVMDTSGLTLGTNSYPDVKYPDSCRFIEKTEFMPWPSWLYRCQGTAVRKEIFMRENEAAVWLAYTLEDGPDEAGLDLKFLFTFRDSHELTKANDSINCDIRIDSAGLEVRPYQGLPAARIIFSGNWNQEGTIYWDYNVCYEMEKERGHEWIEDRFVPGRITASVQKKIPLIIRVGIDEVSGLKDAPGRDEMIAVYEAEKKLRFASIGRPQKLHHILRKQARHFLLKNPSGKLSINAGYPWFGEWGRDTMIALPGLTFYNGKIQTGVEILCDYISMIKDGLLPNTLGDTQGFTSYNSIDAGLLFCWAVGKLQKSGYGCRKAEKIVLIEKILPAVKAIVDAFFENRVPNAYLTRDGLIYSGNPNTQLTWMDATAWGRPVTSRHGLAVELNALWYDALSLLDELNTTACLKTADKISDLHKKFPKLYRSTFWLEDEQYLSDTVNENGPDRKLRPNMLFASSASRGLLSMEQRRAVVGAAEKHLLTPMGLRTLSLMDPDFQGVYNGGPDQRDSRYHQGTVWPWPIGIMVESSLLTAQDIEKKARFWSDYIEHLLEEHLLSDGWGFISEIFDGLIPGRGKGSFAQAWSSSEVIRAAKLINRILN